MKKFKLIFITPILLFITVLHLYGSMVWSPVSTPGFGNIENTIFYPGPIKDGYFYIGTYNIITGGQLYRTSDAINFLPVNNNGFGLDSINSEIKPFQELFKNEIYVYTENSSSGLQIWKSVTGDVGAWINVGTNGMSFGYMANKIYGSVIFNNELYIGFSENGMVHLSKNSDGSTNWAEVATNFFASIVRPDSIYNGWLYIGYDNGAPGLKRYNGSTFEIITTNGFGDANNLEEIRPVYKGFAGYIYAALVNYSGAQLWRSSTGAAGTWNKIFDFNTIDSNNTKIVSFSIPGDGYLYFSTYNNKTGTEVWRTGGGTSDFEQVNLDGFGNGTGVTNISCYLSHNLFNGLMFACVQANSGGAMLYTTPINIGESIDKVIRTADELHIIGSADPQYLGAFVPDSSSAVSELTMKLDNISSGSLRFRIFTLTGETIYDDEVSCNAQGSFILEIPSDIAAGTYIIKVEAPNFNFTKKLAVLR